MKRTVEIAVVLTVALILCGCRGQVRNSGEEGEVVYSPEYAAGFSVVACGENSTIIKITDPWQGAVDVEKNIFLSRGGELPPAGFDGVVLNAPVQRVIPMSSSYIAFMDAIDCVDAVKGVSGADYITNPVIRERFAEGSLKDVGYDNYINYELVTSLRPELVMLYGVAGENMVERKLAELGVEVTYIGDYVENSPLAKAEWIVAFGEMFDKRDEAVAAFNQVRDEYLKTKGMVEERIEGRKKPVVMLNAPYRDTWFVPGDRNYIVRLMDDAGADYACSGDDSERSRALSGETAFVAASKSDIWLNPGMVTSMREVVMMNPKFTDIPSVKSGNVYNCDARRTPEGGSDFWESGALRADIVLKDLVKIFHPELMPEHELYYFRQLK